MFDNLKRTLYFYKEKLLFSKGIIDGDIVPFDDEFYEQMSHTYINCIPVSMHIKYLRPTDKQELGKCFDRSLYMFFCFKDAILVRGDNKELEYQYGLDNASHGWIEKDGYCYDPSLLLRFKKELYYNIYKPSDVTKTTVFEYKTCSKENKYFYEKITNTTLKDFLLGGKKRIELGVSIPLIKGIADISGNEDFKEELNTYLELIQYDEKEVFNELDIAFKKSLTKK